MFGPNLLGNFFESLADNFLSIGTFPFRIENSAALLSSLTSLFFFFVGSDFSSGEDVPWCKCHTL